MRSRLVHSRLFCRKSTTVMSYSYFLFRQIQVFILHGCVQEYRPRWSMQPNPQSRVTANPHRPAVTSAKSSSTPYSPSPTSTSPSHPAKKALPPFHQIPISPSTKSNSQTPASRLTGQDVVISALGATAFSEQKQIVDAAVKTGVKHFIPSEFSASSQDAAVLRLLPLFGKKREVIEYLESKQCEGLSWTGVAAGLLFDWV